jgi:peptidoglycan hydrolase CwlO-like protein
MPKMSTAPGKELLEAALQGLEAQKQKIDDQIGQVRRLMGQRGGRPAKQSSASTSTASAAPAAGRKRRVLSPEARKRIAAAQKKRWAAFRKGQKGA